MNLVHVRRDTCEGMCRKKDSAVRQKVGSRGQESCMSCGTATAADAAKLIAETGLQIFWQLDLYLQEAERISLVDAGQKSHTAWRRHGWHT